MNASPRGRRAPATRLLALTLSLLAVAAASPLAPHSTHAARQGTGDAALAGPPKCEAAEFVPGEALVRFRDEDGAGADAAATTIEVAAADSPAALFAGSGPKQKITARFRRFGGSDIVRGLRLAKLSKGDKADASADPKQTLAAVAALNERADVLYAEPNYVWRAKAVPNDPRFGEQYGMQRISAPAAWDITTGSNSVVVAVIDGGVDLSHPDLADNAWVNPGETPGDGVDNDGNGFTDDVNGWDFHNKDRTVFDGQDGDDHGTHVAGIVGARGNNGIGVTGVNWQVSIMSVKVLGPDGGSTANIIAGYEYVRKMKVEKGINVRVTNNSYGGPGRSQAAFNAISALNAAGILFVAAAGNDAQDNFSFEEFPSNYDAPNVLAVASTNSPDALSPFSNFSSRLVSMGAPGSGILSTVPPSMAGACGAAAGPEYCSYSGTSMATPHVAGAAALLLSVAPNVSVANLRGALAFTGDRIPALQNNTTTGRRLNVRAALDAVRQNDSAAPAQTALAVAAQSGRSLTLTFAAPGDDGLSGTAADYDFYFVDPALGLRILLPTSAAPAAGGSQQSVTVDTPLRSLNGTVELVTYDDNGNSSTSALAVSVQQNPGTDPYAVTQSAPEALSTGGTRLALDGDDKYLAGHALPFAFPFYGQPRTQLTVSSNGVLYFSTPVRRDNGDADDVPSSVAAVQGQTLVAGLWDDLELDAARRADAGVFVTQPDANRVVFRWQATTFPTPIPGGNRGVHHVNFEIELRSDGTVVTRYGPGNQNLFPVVAISGGEPTAYHVPSHTSENALKSLNAAQTVTFAPRTSAAAIVRLNSESLSVGESAGRVQVSITRAGDLSGVAAVDYATADADSFTVGCADAPGAAGSAFARCDFATAAGTVVFAPGETTKTVSVLVIDDGHAEGPETFQLRLSRASGATLASPDVLTVTITDNDTAGTQNPVTSTNFNFFVRQQYLDFLSREPDGAGLGAWLGVLQNCPNPFAGPSAQSQCDRIHVSGEGFFRSNEFRLKGFYVFRFYRAAFGRLPEYAEIISDMSFVAGATEAEVYARRAELAARFTQRPEFTQLYAETSNQQYVAALLGRYSLQQVTTPDPANPDAGAKVVLTGAQLADRLGGVGGTLTRAQVLRAVADSDEVGAREFNNAFVAMQYYGYLRRKPDQAGYDSWLLVLQSGDVRTMVNGFLNSTEYRLRFGRE